MPKDDSKDSENLAGLIALITDLQKTQILTAKLDKYEKQNENLNYL